MTSFIVAKSAFGRAVAARIARVTSSRFSRDIRAQYRATRRLTPRVAGVALSLRAISASRRQTSSNPDAILPGLVAAERGDSQDGLGCGRAPGLGRGDRPLLSRHRMGRPGSEA